MKTILTLNNSKTTIVQVKNDVLVSNTLQLREIERYAVRHPEMSTNDAAIRWIARNSAQWRHKHPLAI
jgi:hypothetical protein